MTLAIPHARSVADEVPPVVGARLTVPLVDGRRVPYANLDHAASAPCLDAVRTAVDELLPWYASVHRGAGFASQVSTKVFERARDVVGRFVGARRGDAVVFTRNTTDALNLLARAVPRATSVVLFDTDHHAALLPWRGPNVHRLSSVDRLDAALRSCPTGPRLVVVTGASNVTGELWPVADIAATARRHGARVVLDAAQLAPHRPVDLRALDVDYVVLSGHKLYAPFGAGALIGRADWLRAAEPYLAGGGATSLVADRGAELAVSWSTGPERHEAGSPNVVGAHALAVACETIERNRPAIVAHERALLGRLRTGLAGVAGLRELSLFAADRVGVVSFAVDGQDPGLLAAALSAEHGIGVRDGAFCAHIGTRRLLATAGAAGTRALRASIGLGSTVEHVDRLVAALHTLVATGPTWDYELVDGRWTPTPDPRALPPFLAAA
ncbi:MAG TPA: aminotransferase class V-fold PLP-dependent enzyme [Actinophytocola sp.]|nr:aminotransferase class V-fold PLP-dependent enzyme [Actinophytocola sp.]